MDIPPRNNFIFASTAHIDNEKMESIKNTADKTKATEMSLWHRIQDWFSGGVRQEAHDKIYYFFHGTDAQKEEAFDFLKRTCEKDHETKFEEKVNIDMRNRVFTIHADGVDFSQAVALTERESADYLVKHYQDFFAAPIDDQNGFVEFFKNKTALREYSDGLYKAMDSAADNSYDEMSNKEFRYSPLGQWAQKKFSSVLTENPEIMTYIIENRNHAAIKEWRTQHPSVDALSLSPAAQERFNTGLLVPVEGKLRPSGLSEQAAEDWNRTVVTIGGRIYERDVEAAALALHTFTGDRKLSELISQYANQGSLSFLSKGLINGDIPVFLPDGQRTFEFSQSIKSTQYVIAKDGDSIRLSFVYSVDSISCVTVVADNECGIENIPTDPANSFVNFNYALRIGRDYKVSIAEPLRFEAEFRFPEEERVGGRAFV